MAEKGSRIGEELETEKHQIEENQASRGQTPDGPRHVEQPVIPNVKLCIRSQDGEEYYYRVQRDKRIGNLLLSYCHEKHIDYHAVTFIFDGRQLKPTKTPDELGMDNEDVIDVMRRQTGGGF